MPSPRHALRPGLLDHLPGPLRSADGRLTDRAVRLVSAAVATVLLLGAGAAASSAAPSPAPEPARASVRLTAQVQPRPVPVVRRSAAPKAAPHAAPRPVRRPAAPVRRPAAAPHQRAAAPARWLPTGTGMWLHEFSRSERGNARAVVGRARLAGLSHVFVQTGSSKRGAFGGPTLRALLPATKGSGIKVVAWDFPSLKDPVADARRLAGAGRFHCPGCPRVAAVAPDIETPAEGTHLSGPAVVRYYDELRKRLPADVAILATVPWPSEKRVRRYPYALTAHKADAVLPMAYWYNRSPAGVTAASISYLQRFGKPVMPVGQGYDGRLDAPYLARDPNPYRSVQSFLQTAHRHGARSVSLWSWQTTGVPQWQALSRGRGLFPRSRR